MRQIGIVAAVVLVACSPAVSPDLAVGNPAPPLLAASTESSVRATWVFSGRDLIRCRSSARELRGLQARFGGRVEIVAVAFRADRHSVESFLKRERVHAEVKVMGTIDEDEARGVRMPALYLVKGRTVAAIHLGVPMDDARSMRSRDVQSEVASLLGRSGASTMPGE